MTTAVTSPAPAPQGHCSRCGKVWTLNERQGICQWCKRSSSCEATKAKPRHVKSNRRRKPTQADGNGNGYDQLPEPHLTYYKVASRFSYKARAQDREDLLHNIMIALADVASSNGHKPFTELAMYRVASVTRADYWRAQYKLTNGLDCGSCSKAQRRKCRKDWLYTECPKAIKLEYLSKPMVDSEGNLTELGELIADDKAIDLDLWLDAEAFLLGCKPRLVGIAHKIRQREGLTATESRYLYKFRQKHQKALF